jgi:hypothetical protein
MVLIINDTVGVSPHCVESVLIFLRLVEAVCDLDVLQFQIHMQSPVFVSGTILQQSLVAVNFQHF